MFRSCLANSLIELGNFVEQIRELLAVPVICIALSHGGRERVSV